MEERKRGDHQALAFLSSCKVMGNCEGKEELVARVEGLWKTSGAGRMQNHDIAIQIIHVMTPHPNWRQINLFATKKVFVWRLVILHRNWLDSP